mgnify:CR=1 FL=1
MPALPDTDAVILPEGLLYVDGVLRRAENDRTYDNIGPWTGKPVGVAADASARDVEEAIVAARRAFDTTDWSTNHAKRFALVKKLYDLFEAKKWFPRCSPAAPSFSSRLPTRRWRGSSLENSPPKLASRKAC